MYRFYIDEIITKNNTTIKPKKINIIVGANSCGKSRFLKDIRYFLDKSDMGNNNDQNLIIENIKYPYPNDSNDFIKSYDLENKVKIFNNNYYLSCYSGLYNIMTYNGSNNFLDNNVNNLYNNWKADLSRVIKSDEFIRMYGKLFFNYLGNEEKLLLCKRQSYHSYEDYGINFLSEVSKSPNVLNKLSNYTKILFNKDICLDKTLGTNILFRVGDDFSFYRNALKEDVNADNKLTNYPTLDNEGDGIKSFVSSFLTLKSANKDLILLDEPESFLHPPIAKKFGEIIAKEVENDKQIFIATHSEDILNGILSFSNPTNVNIIKITKDGLNSKFDILEDSDISFLKRKALISSSNILKGLFTNHVFITESYTDSVIYQKILNKFRDSSEYYFLNTQSKNTIHTPLKLFNKLHINAYAIYDFDIIRDAKDIYNILQQLNFDDNISKEIRDVFNNLRSYYRHKDHKAKEDYLYHQQGIRAIKDKKLKDKVNKIIDLLKDYHIIILKTGCLESIFDSVIDFSEDKSSWYDTAFDYLDKVSIDDLKKHIVVESILYK